MAIKTTTKGEFRLTIRHHWLGSPDYGMNVGYSLEYKGKPPSAKDLYALLIGKRILPKVQNNQELWEKIGTYLNERITKRCFDQEKDQQGNTWQPLAQSTIEWKRKRYYPHPERILYRTGTMRKTTSRIVKAQKDGVRVEWDLSKVPYAIYHERGATHSVHSMRLKARIKRGWHWFWNGGQLATSVSFPARPSMNGISKAAERRIIEMIRQEIGITRDW